MTTETQSSIATKTPGKEDQAEAFFRANRAEVLGSARIPNPDGDDTRQEDASSVGETGRGAFHAPDLPYMKLAALSMIGVGALIIVFLAYLFAFTSLTASRNQHRLVQSLVGQPLAVYSLVGGHVPAEGKAVAILQIPALHLQQVVVEGTSAADLMNGPGLLPGSALPGSPGNAVIAGRRVTYGGPFGSLGTLHPGDKIQVVDGVGKFTYRVTRILTVTAGKRDVVVPTADNRITLITSDSSVVTDGRLAVQGKLVGRAVAIPGSVVTLPRRELGLSGDSVAGAFAVIWSLLTLIVLVGAGLVVWRWKRPWLVYLFAAPVIVACGLFACESVARALPATF